MQGKILYIGKGVTVAVKLNVARVIGLIVEACCHGTETLAATLQPATPINTGGGGGGLGVNHTPCG